MLERLSLKFSARFMYYYSYKSGNVLAPISHGNVLSDVSDQVLGQVHGSGFRDHFATLLAEFLHAALVEIAVGRRKVECRDGVLDEPGQVGNFPVATVLEALAIGPVAVVTPTEVASGAAEEDHPAGDGEDQSFSQNSPGPAEDDDGEGGELEGPNGEPREDLEERNPAEEHAN